MNQLSSVLNLLGLGSLADLLDGRRRPRPGARSPNLHSVNEAIGGYLPEPFRSVFYIGDRFLQNMLGGASGQAKTWGVRGCSCSSRSPEGPGFESMNFHDLSGPGSQPPATGWQGADAEAPGGWAPDFASPNPADIDGVSVAQRAQGLSND